MQIKNHPKLNLLRLCYGLLVFFFLLTTKGYSQGANCASAETLTINGACDTSTTITDNTQNTPNATGCSFNTFRREGWYTFTVTGGPLNINITADAADRDLFLQLISSTSSCTGLSQIACANTTTSNGAQTETISTTLANGIYYVKVINNRQNGDMALNSICVTAPSGNDDCSGAVPLTINTSCSYSTYTTTGATASAGAPAPGCASYSGGDVWFSFVVPANGQVTVDTQTGGMTDSGMAWYTGTCGSLTLLECDDDDSANGLMSSITRTGLTPGATIYVRIWEFSNDNPGTFGICATSPGPCTTPGAQASGFTPGTITSTAFPATFSGSADSYLVIRSTSATPPSQPVNGVVYNAGNIGTLGAGLTVVQNGASTTITGTGLNGNTHYYYYIYAYNNTGCSGGPLYNTSGPLTGNAVTCPATPSPVSTSSTLTSIDFSWPSSLGGGANAVTYQLQVTTDAGYTANVPGSPFTINDPTTTYNLAGLTPNTTYYYRIRANNGCWSTYTTGTAVTGYCAYTTSDNSYWISNFNTTGGSTNINRTSTYTAGGYANYSATDVVTQVQGSSFNFSVTMSSGTHGINIYVDWNNDLDFADAGELVYASGAYVGSATGTITIPGTASVGNHRMRVVTNWLSTNPSACGSSTYTEAEDYTVNVLAPAPCAGTPTAGTVTVNPNTAWPGASYVVSATGYSLASNLTFQWQYSTDGGTIWNNAGAATGTYADYNATAPASGDVHWQLIVTCTNSGLSDTSTDDIFVTMAVSDVETGCPGVVAGGFGLSGADHSPIACTAGSTCVDIEATYLNLGNTSSYIVEPIAYNPPFAFNGLANPVSVNIDDRWSPIVNLPFDFCFYGNTYNQCLIGSNGIITFDTVNNTPTTGFCDWSFSDNIPIAGDAALVENSIFGVFHDINPGVGGEVGWELVTLASGCRALVASWYNVPLFGDNTQFYTGMMVLYENSNVIEVYIQHKPNDPDDWNDNNAIVGIQNSTGTVASVAPGRNGLDADWTATSEAWRFVPNGASITTLTWYEGSGTSGPVLGTTDTLNVCPTATTTYTAAVTYTFCDGSTLTETEETIVTINGSKVWNGSVNNDWDNNNNWTPVGRPTALDCVVIPNTANDPVISGAGYNGLGLNMSIQNDAVLTVNSDNAVSITDWVNISATGELVLDDSASLIQTNNIANTGTGSMYMDRDVNIRRLDYVYWSSPVTSFPSSSISPGSPTSLIWKWTPTVAGNGVGNSGDWVNGNENMTIGKGYIVRGPSSYNSTLQNYTATFVGTPNNGNLSIPISRGSYTSVVPYQVCPTCTPATNLDDNWNLVGNPYPSAIDAIDFLSANTNIDGYIKVWTHGTLPSNAIADPFYENFTYNYSIGDYITYNSLGASAGPGVFNGYIAAGQGFFVSMLNSGGATQNLNFTNALRSNTYDNSQFYRTTGNEKHRIWLDIISSTNESTRTLVGYVDGASNSRDRLFDAETDNKISLNLYSIVDNERFNIQGKQAPFDENDIVPLGFKVPSDGLYNIAVGALDGLFETTNQTILLEDKELNIIYDLRVAPYSFMTNAGVNDNRFNLIFKNTLKENSDELVDNNLWVSTSNSLTVHSSKENIASIKVFDLLGRLLTLKENITSHNVALENILKNNSGLILEITMETGKVVYKKTIF